MLQLSGLLREVQNTVEDLPFDGHNLFSAATTDSLHMLKDSRATLFSLGFMQEALQ